MNVLGIFTSFRYSTLFKTSVAGVFLKFSSAGLLFFNSLMMAHVLGAQELGVYTIAFSLVNLLTTIISLGLPLFVCREVAKYQARKQWGLLSGFILEGHRWVGWVVFIIFGIGLLLRSFDLIPSNISPQLAVIVLLMAALASFSQVKAALLRGLQHVIIADIPELLLRPLLMLSMLSASYYWLQNITAQNAMVMQLAALLICYFLYLFYVRRYKPIQTRTVSRETQSSDWFKELYYFFWISLFSPLENQVGIYVLGYVSGSVQVALFQVAAQLVGLIVIGLMAVNMPLQAKLAAAWANGDKEKSQYLVYESAKIGMFFALIGAMFLCYLPDFILGLYGEEFLAAVDILRVLAIGQIFNALCGPCGLVLTATGYQNYAFYGVLLSLIIKVFLTFVLAKSEAALGAAWAAVAGLITWNCVMVYWARKKAGIYTFSFKLMSKA